MRFFGKKCFREFVLTKLFTVSSYHKRIDTAGKKFGKCSIRKPLTRFNSQHWFVCENGLVFILNGITENVIV